ncbi:hypothetical protein, partial [Methanoregula sp.]|uniref:hypothetical protein n=1 Tax=Methanoregula sp. TaxID=2052170 RepID=UPI000CB57347
MIALFLLGILLLPASAATIAIYGDTAGFSIDAHRDEFTVACQHDGSSGAALDRDIACFTDPSVAVIFMGGDESFSATTAGQIQEAAYGGKILVVTNKHYKKINASLPAANTGPVPEGQSLQVANPESPLAMRVFEGLRNHYPVTRPLADRMNTVANPGADVLLTYETGDPALLYWSYGRGFVVEWATTSPLSYLNSTEADFINARLIRYLLARPVPVTTATTTT